MQSAGVSSSGANSHHHEGGGEQSAAAAGQFSLPKTIPDSMKAQELIPYVREVLNPATRERALLELSRRREACEDLAPLLWNCFGVPIAILQELIAIYPQLNPPALTAASGNRVCNAIALLQCVASHPDTIESFLHSGVIYLLYPFLDTTNPARLYEYLRLTSLGVVGAMLKTAPSVAVPVVLQSELVPFTLRIMESGLELSRTVATFIIQMILSEDCGLSFLCATAERLFALTSIIGCLFTKAPSHRLLRNLLRCSMRLCERKGVSAALVQTLWPQIQRAAPYIAEDPPSEELFKQLHSHLAPFLAEADNTNAVVHQS